jgi:hypothetical protein
MLKSDWFAVPVMIAGASGLAVLILLMTGAW